MAKPIKRGTPPLRPFLDRLLAPLPEGEGIDEQADRLELDRTHAAAKVVARDLPETEAADPELRLQILISRAEVARAELDLYHRQDVLRTRLAWAAKKEMTDAERDDCFSARTTLVSQWRAAVEAMLPVPATDLRLHADKRSVAGRRADLPKKWAAILDAEEARLNAEKEERKAQRRKAA